MLHVVRHIWSVTVDDNNLIQIKAKPIERQGGKDLRGAIAYPTFGNLGDESASKESIRASQCVTG